MTGDVDGDGIDDAVSLTRAGVLRVALGSGTTVRHRIAGSAPAVEGLVDAAAGRLVVTSRRARDLPGRDWTVWRVDDGPPSGCRCATGRSSGPSPTSPPPGPGATAGRAAG